MVCGVGIENNKIHETGEFYVYCEFRSATKVAFFWGGGGEKRTKTTHRRRKKTTAFLDLAVRGREEECFWEWKMHDGFGFPDIFVT